jgi:hypothetical protein
VLKNRLSTPLARSIVADDGLGSQCCLAAIPEHDSAQSRGCRCDREERGQRTRIQVADASRRQRPSLLATADSLTADSGARGPATASNAITAATTASASTASTASAGPAACSTSTAAAAFSTSTATRYCWSNDPRRCLWRFDRISLTRRRSDGRRTLRDCPLTGGGCGDSSCALGDGALIAIGLGQGGSSLDARCAAGSNRLRRRGSSHRGARTGTHLRAGRFEDDHVAVGVIVGPCCLR